MNLKKCLIATLPLLLQISLVGCKNNEEKKPTIEDYDVVGQTHMNITDELFEKLMKKKTSTNFDPENYLDFQNDGIEKMQTEYDNGGGDAFTNYVDGDTTQFSSYNGGYTVKVRYLSVDTPESTSEIEKWGKAASNFNKKILKEAKYVVVQSKDSALYGDLVSPSGVKVTPNLDGYGRALAYVWYSNELNPKKEDFRNLNLELVYNGYSLNNSKQSDMQESFYQAFVDADNISREVKKWHLGSSDDTVDDCYYDKKPKKIELRDLYDKDLYTTNHPKNESDNGTNYSSYCDYYTRWTFENVTVSAMIGNAFYIQKTYDKGTANEKTYGLYVFTMRNYECVKVGNVLNVTGILEWYGGSYELAGVHYDRFTSEKHGWDMTYCYESDGKTIKREKITPKEVTPKEMESGNYECNFVKLVSDHNDTTKDSSIYLNTAYSFYNSEVTSYSMGGSEELNMYNDAHPFYNTDNKITLFGSFGKDSGNISSYPTSSDTDKVRIVISSSLTIPNYQKPSVEISMDFSKKDQPAESAFEQAIVGDKYFIGSDNKPLSGEQTASFNGRDVKFVSCYKKSTDDYLTFSKGGKIQLSNETNRDINRIEIELADGFDSENEINCKFNSKQGTSISYVDIDKKLNEVDKSTNVLTITPTSLSNMRSLVLSNTSESDYHFKTIKVYTADGKAENVIGDSVDATTDWDSKQDAILSYKYFTGTHTPTVSKDDKGNDVMSDTDFELNYVYYCPDDPELAYKLEHNQLQYDNLTEEQKKIVTRKSYSRKKLTGCYGIAQNYTSASGKNSKVTLNITTQEGIGHIETLDLYK